MINNGDDRQYVVGFYIKKKKKGSHIAQTKLHSFNKRKGLFLLQQF